MVAVNKVELNKGDVDITTVSNRVILDDPRSEDTVFVSANHNQIINTKHAGFITLNGENKDLEEGQIVCNEDLIDGAILCAAEEILSEIAHKVVTSDSGISCVQNVFSKHLRCNSEELEVNVDECKITKARVKAYSSETDVDSVNRVRDEKNVIKGRKKLGKHSKAVASLGVRVTRSKCYQ
ncbi:hypothetical protein REPUB_Repub02eG0108300 [Reevesia pubescens]